MIVDRQLAHTAVPGVEVVISIEVYDDDGTTELYPTGGSVEVWKGHTVEHSESSLTFDGNRAEFNFTPDAAESPSELWSVRWMVQVDGRTEPVRERLHIITTPLRPSLTVRRFQELVEGADCFIGGDIGAKIGAAWRRMLRDLESQGHRVHLIADPHMLFDPHLALAKHFVFRDAAKSIGDARYRDAAKAALDEYKHILETRTFRYDHDQDGVAEFDEYGAASAGWWGNAHPHPNMGRRQ